MRLVLVAAMLLSAGCTHALARSTAAASPRCRAVTMAMQVPQQATVYEYEGGIQGNQPVHRMQVVTVPFTTTVCR